MVKMFTLNRYLQILSVAVKEKRPLVKLGTRTIKLYQENAYSDITFLSK